MTRDSTDAPCRPWPLGLRAKLFIALLVTVTLAVAVTSTAARFAFLRGFLGYLNDQELASVARILPVLANDLASTFICWSADVVEDRLCLLSKQYDTLRQIRKDLPGVLR